VLVPDSCADPPALLTKSLFLTRLRELLRVILDGWPLGLFWIGGGGIGSLKDWLRATAGDVVSFVILFKVDFNIEEVPAGLLAEFVEGSETT